MKEALKLALDLAIMHHSDDGYAELRLKVRQLAKEALALTSTPCEVTARAGGVEMNERDDEIAKLIYGTQATYQEMQFADLIRANEREACAKLCQQPIDEIQITDIISEVVYMDAHECAEAIRARGQT